MPARQVREMELTPTVLIISKEAEHQCELVTLLESLGARAVCCESAGAARELLDGEQFHLAFCVSPECDFSPRIAEIRPGGRQIPVVVVTRHDDWAHYLSAMSGGAFDYIVTPLQAVEVGRALRAALGNAALGSGSAEPKARIPRKQRIGRGRKARKGKRSVVLGRRLG